MYFTPPRQSPGNHYTFSTFSDENCTSNKIIHIFNNSLMFIDIKFCQFMPGFLISNKPGGKGKEGKVSVWIVCKWTAWRQTEKSNANSILIKKRFIRITKPNPLGKHSLFQILIQFPNGLHIFPLGFSNCNLTLSCSLWVDINKGLGPHDSPGFCKEGNLAVQIIISMPVKFHCRTNA